MPKKLPLTRLRGLENLELPRWQVPFNRFLDQGAQDIGLDRIQLDRDGTEAFGSAVGGLGRAGWQVLPTDLLRRDAQPLEPDLGVGR